MMAAKVERVTARIDGDFVVFLIGMRVNKPWKPWKWVPAARAMGRMLSELYTAGPEATGFLGHQPLGVFNMVQYWRSFDALEAYARAPDEAHRPAWTAFFQRAMDDPTAVGIWHETYAVPAGRYETIYGAMPDWGLAKAARRLPVGDGEQARDRIGIAAE
jgi:hypothetical protein